MEWNFISICHAYSDLTAKVGSLSTGGTTALGPALAMCVGMASNFPTAEVILCTDGVSNVGVGNLDGGSNNAGFYTTVWKLFVLLRGEIFSPTYCIIVVSV